ncbi:hypothetical protein [Shinella kummerowiae]|uniref:hypothetical protein n=1 Tax=Shinella kummerowiae TaxID=417745 RepID=UPI0021B5F072|nr:hypothetical protein [Shinella kummerowiae]MCT7666459.1 hypothetical protein [Shinella kummerowiae]
MARLLAGKISALAALFTASMIISGCETTAGAPEICKANPKSSRCAKVVKKQPVQVAKVRKAQKASSSVSQTSRNNY